MIDIERVRLRPLTGLFSLALMVRLVHTCLCAVSLQGAGNVTD